MSLDFPGRKSGEHGPSTFPNFANRTWQNDPVVWIEARNGTRPAARIFAGDRHRLSTGGDWNDRPSQKMLQSGSACGRCFHNGPATDLHMEISMDDEIEIQDLAADEIRELLLEEGSELDEQQAAALKQFIEDIGGLENALAAVAMLDVLEEAA